MQKTAYEMRIRDWSADVCASDLAAGAQREQLSPPDARLRRADQHPLGLRQPHRRPARAELGLPLAPRREPPGRRRRQSLPGDRRLAGLRLSRHEGEAEAAPAHRGQRLPPRAQPAAHPLRRARARRSEEHTSELQSLMRIPYAVFGWKKKTNKIKKL